MYLTGTEIAINWSLYANVAPPSLRDFGITECSPSGITTGMLPAVAGNYVVPSRKNTGFLTHKFTPDVRGLWRVSLHILGTHIYTHEILVSENDVYTKKFVHSRLL